MSGDTRVQHVWCVEKLVAIAEQTEGPLPVSPDLQDFSAFSVGEVGAYEAICSRGSLPKFLIRQRLEFLVEISPLVRFGHRAAPFLYLSAVLFSDHHYTSHLAPPGPPTVDV